MAVQNIPWISPEEFLDQEALAATRHIYFKGLVTAMAGGSIPHGIVAANLLRAIGNALAGRDCSVVGSDVMIRTGSAEMLVYPDITVICGKVETMPGDQSSFSGGGPLT